MVSEKNNELSQRPIIARIAYDHRTVSISHHRLQFYWKNEIKTLSNVATFDPLSIDYPLFQFFFTLPKLHPSVCDWRYANSNSPHLLGFQFIFVLIFKVEFFKPPFLSSMKSSSKVNLIFRCSFIRGLNSCRNNILNSLVKRKQVNSWYKKKKKRSCYTKEIEEDNVKICQAKYKGIAVDRRLFKDSQRFVRHNDNTMYHFPTVEISLESHLSNKRKHHYLLFIL